jgi:hypothetical protein
MVEATTDLVLLSRHLRGLTGAALINSALGTAATRRSASEISSWLNRCHPN